jgi:hypothetical protein
MNYKQLSMKKAVDYLWLESKRQRTPRIWTRDIPNRKQAWRPVYRGGPSSDNSPQRVILVFRRCSVQISAGTPNILTAFFRGFPGCTSIRPWPLPSKSFRLHQSPMLRRYIVSYVTHRRQKVASTAKHFVVLNAWVALKRVTWQRPIPQCANQTVQLK